MQQPNHIAKETTNGTKFNLDALYRICPSCFTESVDADGNLKHVVDFEKLRALLGDDTVENAPEVYDFTWVGKRAAQREAMAPVRKTLRPCPEESVDWDTTKNLYIEGDNLEVLKLLQNSYMGKVKMIYIDPPYNTGNDFIYHDDFHRSQREEDEASGVINEAGERMIKNTETNGKFHSDWCSMIYSRLMVARSLLTEDGVIFISIDDNEVENLKKICDEVLGTSNFITQLVWEKKKKGSFLSNSITNIKEYIIVYCKNISFFGGLIGEINCDTETYPCVNASNKREIRTIPAGIESKYKDKDYVLKKGSEISDTTMSLILHSDLVIKNGVLAEDLTIEGNWRYGQDSMKKYADNNELYITRDLYLRRIVKEKRYKTLKDLLPRVGDNNNLQYNSPININNLFESGWGSNEDADEELRLLLGTQKLLDYPKPVRLLFKLLVSLRGEDAIVLDFFSGSATTAHAVMQLNAEDFGNRKFIMVQLPEETSEDSEAYKAGYRNICQIGKERIRRAGKKIKEENPLTTQDLDTGFRVFKCDDSNYKDVAFAPKDYDQDTLDLFIENIKEDRTDLDLLFDCMLRWGVTLDLPMTSSSVDGCTIHNVNDGDLVACFTGVVTEAVIDAIAQMHPLRVVFRDSSFQEAAEKMNLFELFKQKCDWTDEEVQNNVRVI